ncbi:hypothetical protein EDC04DRAFT_2726326 [Pisolithus marmoratus]|nr:hypothetical protein EDC04DRAFT_2726326 [Pisolithus marmoratus]
MGSGRSKNGRLPLGTEDNAAHAYESLRSSCLIITPQQHRELICHKDACEPTITRSLTGIANYIAYLKSEETVVSDRFYGALMTGEQLSGKHWCDGNFRTQKIVPCTVRRFCGKRVLWAVLQIRVGADEADGHFGGTVGSGSKGMGHSAGSIRGAWLLCETTGVPPFVQLK